MASSILPRLLFYTTIYLALLLLLLLSPSKAAPHNSPAEPIPSNATNLSDPHFSLQRLRPRWYSVPDFATATSPTNQREGLGPWPPCIGSDTSGQIRFCFQTQAALDQLHDMFVAAVAKWAQAMRPYTGLEVGPDPACSQAHWRCLCGPATITETLELRVGPSPWSTLGYNYPGFGQRGRHYLVMNPNWPAPAWITNVWEFRVLTLAHEFGHVIGLGHEHQRPGAESMLRLALPSFIKYNEMLGTIMQDRANAEPLFQGVDSAAQRLTILSRNVDLARRYWPELVHWMPDTTNTQTRHLMDQGGPMDLNSIMIYPTFTGEIIYDPANRPVVGGLFARVPDANAPDGARSQAIYMGGHADPQRAGISIGDFRRVLALYPLPAGGWPQPHAQPRLRRRDDKLPKVKVTIADFTTTVSPVPEQTPVVRGTKEWGDEAEKWAGRHGKFVEGLGDDSCVMKRDGSGCAEP